MVQSQLPNTNGGAPLTKFMQVKCHLVYDAICDVESLQRFALQSSTMLKQVSKCSREWTSAHTNKVGQVTPRNDTWDNTFDVYNMHPNASRCSNDCSEGSEMRTGNARQVLSLVQR